MIYELDIEDGKEKPIINFLKQLDFLTIRQIKKSEDKITPTKKEAGSDLSYFDTCPEWELNTDELRKMDTAKRIKGWL